MSSKPNLDAGKSYRIPRSISEQESLMAKEGTILPIASEQPLPNETRDLMNLRARGIFDDHDITDLLEAIKRTQMDRSPQSSEAQKKPTIQAPFTAASVSFTDISKSKRARNDDSEYNQPNGEETFKYRGDPKVSPESQYHSAKADCPCLANKYFTESKKEVKPTTTPGINASSPSKQLSAIKVRAIVLRCIEISKSASFEMCADNIDLTKQSIQTALAEALDALSSETAPFKGKEKALLSHCLQQARLTSFSLDPYTLMDTKEIILRHLDEAMTILVPPGKGKRKRSTTLAKKIIDYAAKDPTGSNIVPPRPTSNLKVEPTESPVSKPKAQSSEQLIKATIVRCIDRAKTGIFEANSGNIKIIKESIKQNLDVAAKAVLELKESLTETNKNLLQDHLQQAIIMNSSLSATNLDATKALLHQKFDEAVAILLPAKSVRPKPPSARRSLAKEIKNFAANSRLIPENVLEIEQLEQAINRIRKNCSNSDLILFISPAPRDSEEGSYNLQITAVNRESGKIQGQLLIPECVYAMLINKQAFSKYFTVRISHEINDFQFQLAQILRYLNQMPRTNGVPSSLEQIPDESQKQKLEVSRKPNSKHSGLSSSTIRRTITINPPLDNSVTPAPAIPQESRDLSIAELLAVLKTDSWISDHVDQLFELAEKNKFILFAHPDFWDESSTYLCQVFTSGNEFIGNTKLRGEDILEQLRKHPKIVENFEIVVDVADVVLPPKFKKLLLTFFQKIGLLSLYDRLGMVLFNIYKKWGLNGMKN